MTKTAETIGWLLYIGIDRLVREIHLKTGG